MSLRVEHLDKDYPTPTSPLSVLRNVNLEVQRGEAVAVMGPSGSGKSTLLHILGTLDRPTHGSVRLGDQDPFALSDAKLADFRNRSIGFVFQDHHLLPQCSVLENVLIPTLAGKDDRAESQGMGVETAGARRPVRPSQSSAGRAERRGTAARGGGAGVDPSSAVAAGRRADRQPGSRQVR